VPVERPTQGTYGDTAHEYNAKSDETRHQKTHAFAPAVISFLGFFCLWIVLSGQMDFFHIGLGLISCLLVTAISRDLLFPNHTARGFFRSGIRFLGYVPWLLYKIFMANLHVLALTFHPKMMERIDPQIFRFQSRLHKDLALVTFANSITLTPGTITVYVNMNGTFTVHAIDWASREDLPGEMEDRIAAVFEGE
jgi:multicomponent Na+:H+ antiporter subunit E